MEKFNWLLNNFDPTFVYTGRALTHKFKFVGLYSSLEFTPPLHAHARENLLVNSFTYQKMDNFIYTLTSLYKFPIWDIHFPL